MKKIRWGIILGIIFAIVDALLMLPLPLPEKTLAIAGASINRFAIGFLIPTIVLPFPGWASGALIGLVLSLPDGLITHMVLPIVGIGTVGGLLLGVLYDKVTKK